LPQTFKRELDVQEQCKDNGNGCPILLFSYLRGLDGLLPGKREADADRQRKNNKEPEKMAPLSNGRRVTAKSIICGD
jgi:hypothetical protein